MNQRSCQRGVQFLSYLRCLACCLHPWLPYSPCFRGPLPTVAVRGSSCMGAKSRVCSRPVFARLCLLESSACWRHIGYIDSQAFSTVTVNAPHSADCDCAYWSSIVSSAIHCSQPVQPTSNTSTPMPASQWLHHQSRAMVVNAAHQAVPSHSLHNEGPSLHARNQYIPQWPHVLPHLLHAPPAHMSAARCNQCRPAALRHLVHNRNDSLTDRYSPWAACPS